MASSANIVYCDVGLSLSPVTWRGDSLPCAPRREQLICFPQAPWTQSPRRAGAGKSPRAHQEVSPLRIRCSLWANPYSLSDGDQGDGA